MLLNFSRYRWVLISAACLVWACQAIEVPDRAAWGGEVKFEASGGFAGIRQSLIIRNDGTFVARDDRLKKEVRGRLDTETLDKLVSAFRSSDEKAEISKPSSMKRCADCFQYSIRATVDNRQHKANVNSVSVGASSYDQAVKSLLLIVRESLSQSEPSHK